MLSRVAENIYWLGRYVERSENIARLINVNAFLLLDLPRGIAPGWEPLIAITGQRAQFEARYKDYSERNVVKYLIGDQDNSGSILSSLHQARENCRSMRDIVPKATWEMLTELNIHGRDNLQAGLTKKGRHAYLKHIIEGSQLLTGMLGSTLSRDEAWGFLRMGRYLERADMTSRIVDVRTASLLPEDTTELRPFETIQWMSVLKSLSSYHMYRRSMQVRVSRSDVLRFLLQDEAFPRSFLHCLHTVEQEVSHLPRNQACRNAIRELQDKVADTEVEQLEQNWLHLFIDQLQLGLSWVHDTLAAGYFLPVEPDSRSSAG
jgi:uncharacterized alpha-E superfamily protein